MSPAHALRCLRGILVREALRFVQQRERFIAALVRPLVWLFVFASGFRATLDATPIEPYGARVDYREYIVPGLCAMVQLFTGMQSSLSMVYDREMGNMRTLLISPLPRAFLLFCRLLAACFVSILQVYLFLVFVVAAGIQAPSGGHVLILGPLIINGLMLGAIGMLLSSVIRQLENFAGVMNFVIFPMFFLSSALYPLARFQDDSPILYAIANLNPLSYAVEFIRFAMYGQLHATGLVVTTLTGLVFTALAVRAYDPARGRRPKR